MLWPRDVFFFGTTFEGQRSVSVVRMRINLNFVLAGAVCTHF